jgi:gentisate 1,2-dioxygenase
MMLRPGETQRPVRRSSSAVFHVVSGRGTTTVNGVTHSWGPKDTFSTPVFAVVEHKTAGDTPAFLVRIHDQPLQEKLGYYEERAR